MRLNLPARFLRASLLLALAAALLPVAAAASPPPAPAAFEASLALQRSTVDQPDDSTLPQIHLMYVLPSDGVDRSFDINGTIENSTASWER